MERSDSRVLARLPRVGDRLAVICGADPHLPKLDALRIRPGHNVLGEEVVAGDWNRSYSRASALYPLAHLRSRGYYPPVSRIDAAYGDRNLVCTCAPIEQYAISLEHATVGS